MRMYMNVYSLPIPSDPLDPSKAIVTLTIGDNAETIQLERFEGGQRLLFPDYIAEQIITALLNQQDITISSERYQSKIIYDDFDRQYRDFVQF